MKPEELAIVAALLRGQRQAALGTLRDGVPFVSMVAYAIEPGFDGFLLHLSRFAQHTRQLLADPRASLLICEGDDGRDDVQTLARITLVGSAAPVAADDLPAARERYLAWLPAAANAVRLPRFPALPLCAQPRPAISAALPAPFTLTAEQLRAAATTDELTTDHRRPTTDDRR